MAQRSFQELDNWHIGVITAVTKDRLPDSAVPEARNAQLYSIGPNHAVIGRRGGCAVLNSTVVGAPSEIIGQYNYDNGAGTIYHLLSVGDGSLKSINSSGTVTAIASAVFTDTDNQQSWDTANGWAYVVNAVDAKKTNGTAVQKFGIGQPGSGDWTLSAVGVGGSLPVDTYDITISYYNSTTGHTGQLAVLKTQAIAAGEKLQVVIPASTTIADSQVDYVRFYIRRQSTQSIQYLVTTGVTVTGGTGAWSATHFGVSVTGATSTVEINLSSTQLAALTLKAPGVNDNVPPPSGAKALAWHRSRMFVVTDTALYWSEVGKPEAFNTTDAWQYVNRNDGDTVLAVHASERGLIIYKRFRTFILLGDDPQTWIIDLLLPDIGCAALNSIISADGNPYWWSQHGPRGLVDGQLVDITTKLISPTIGADELDWTKLSQIVGMVQPYEGWVGWAVPEFGSSRNNIILPYNFKVGAWMSTRWDPVDVRSATTVKDSTGRPWVMLGDYDGWVYRFGQGLTDGIPVTSLPLTGTVTSSTNTTLTVSGATWDVDKLIGKYIYIYPTTAGMTQLQRRRITDNTATQITVVSAWDANPDANYRFVLGGTFFDLRTKWGDFGLPFYKKRFEFAHLHISSPDAVADYDVNIYLDNNESEPVRYRSLSMAGDVGIWDQSLWDAAVFATENSSYERIRIGKVARNWQIRVSNINPQQRLLVLKMGVQAIPLGKKLDDGA